MPEPVIARTAARASRLARRKGRAARVVAIRAAREARDLPGAVEAATHNRQRNRDVLAALGGSPLCGLDETELARYRSLSLLRARAADVRGGTHLEARLVRAGVLSWTSRRVGLRASAEAAAAEALDAGNPALAEWLASAILTSAKSAAAWEVQRGVAVHASDWEDARRWRRRQLLVAAGERSPKADAWVTEERQREQARRLYRLFVAETGATSTDRSGEAGDSVQRWSRAAAASGDEAVRLGALAVVEALRAGRDVQRGRRYEEAFLAERILTDLTDPTDGEGLDRYLPLIHAFARPAPATSPAPVEVASSVRSMNVQAFRNHVAGKSICLVANSPSLIGSGAGELIDGYDLVMRFNSFVIDPEHTGSRTDVHVTIHMHDFNWDVPVPVRIVLSGDPVLWAESLRRRVRPHAQEWLGDDSLRWPARDLGLISPNDPYRTPTAGFNLLQLLLHLDVSTAIDLVGFDFYETGKLRLEGAMQIPHSAAHNSGSERAWVMARADRVTPMVISMKPATAEVAP